MQIAQSLRAIFNLFTASKFKISAEVVEKERVDNFMNIFDAGIMNSVIAACFAVENGFKHGSENGRADFAPTEFDKFLKTHVENMSAVNSELEILIKRRNRDIFFKKSAVDVRKVIKGVAFIFGGIKCVEKILERVAELID